MQHNSRLITFLIASFFEPKDLMSLMLTSKYCLEGILESRMLAVYNKEYVTLLQYKYELLSPLFSPYSSTKPITKYITKVSISISNDDDDLYFTR